MNLKRVPDGYEYFEVSGARILAMTDAAQTIRHLLAQHQTLYDAVRAMPGARPITGRTTAYAADVDGRKWIVRHYVRGGSIAPILGDRYARIVSRSFRELEVTTAARMKGVPTPIVVAAAEYVAAAFLRFDIVLQYIEDSRDLAAAIFEDPHSAEVAAHAIRAAVAGGLVHTDLNLKNILVAGEKAWIIDLDRARLEPMPNRSAALAMRERLLRSLRKWERKTGKQASETARKALEQAFEL